LEEKMKAQKLLLRVYGECQDGQWTLLCLDFSLAAQADTIAEAQRLLREQIVHYVEDVTVGPDQEHAAELLRRPAPLKYWVKYYWHCVRAKVLHHPLRTRRAEVRSMPLVPAGA
jgi:hypothetical protein